MNMNPSGHEAALRAHALLLAWYREMGVDHAVADEATDWLNRGDTRPGDTFVMPEIEAAVPVVAATPRPPQTTIQDRRREAGPPPTRPVVDTTIRPVARALTAAAPDEANLAARAAAREARSIEDLQARLAGFDGCGLKATAKSLCFYRGATPARLMVIGEAPGAEEDKQGAPFVGPAGQLLDKMLAAIGLDDHQVHITNIVYWRPPGNRPPTPQEALVCRPFLERQVEFVKPDVLLLLGGPASNHILEKPEGIMRLRGKWKDVSIGSHSMRAMATLHPAYLLRSPPAKRMVWRDLLAIAEALDLKATP